MIDLILGGARSGKSRLAEQRAHASGQQVVYIATAQHLDGEMAERIQHHQSRRPHQWTTVEEPVALAQALQTLDAPNRLILVDCLTLWVSNLLCLDNGNHFAEHKAALLTCLPGLQSDLIRRFVDESGWLHQDLAQLADRVTLVVAGLPHQLKPANIS